MDISYALFDRSQAVDLNQFLSSDVWPFHVCPRVTTADARARVLGGEFDGTHDRTYWIVADGERIGIVHIEDIGVGDPLFDLRLRSRSRGLGVGTTVVTWLIGMLFDEFPEINRIEATTRRDNVAMRRTLVKCGFVKEAHHRRAWPSENGTLYDSIGYGILRGDWEHGLTTPVEWADEA